ncbi:40S ribosomal protein S2 [Sciurus carolinensis]|uniref:Small ribosomal subunit protein uS5 n=1 Tax=Sciurus carolinensis TaxID=30640 RepID=A0AA41T954_SCICA|nr:40S ribosomal protein S2 [Sciurus carolinensis]
MPVQREGPGAPEWVVPSASVETSSSLPVGGHSAHRGKAEDKEWIPFTKLGRLVKDLKIKSLEEIYLFSLPIEESEIIDFFLGVSLKNEVLKIMPVQKQTHAGQGPAIRGAIILAKLSIVPAQRGYWGNKIGKPHTVPCKVTGRCGSVLVRLIPAPRGTGTVSAPGPKKLLLMAGIDDFCQGLHCHLGQFH